MLHKIVDKWELYRSDSLDNDVLELFNLYAITEKFCMNDMDSWDLLEDGRILYAENVVFTKEQFKQYLIKLGLRRINEFNESINDFTYFLAYEK